MKHFSQLSTATLLLAALLSGCSGGDLTTREKGAGIGALGGAAAGGLIGAATGHPGVGAAVGGALGLGAGALIGDQLQGQENRQKEQQKAIDQQRVELEKKPRAHRGTTQAKYRGERNQPRGHGQLTQCQL